MPFYKCMDGGSQPVLVTKTITQNGTYNASSDSADGYSQVTVNVSGSQPVLITKTITQNGTYNASSDSADGYSQVTVNVSGGIQFLYVDPNDLIANTYIKADGSQENYNGWASTDFISVTSGQTIYYKSVANLTYGCWYDSNKAYISGVTFSSGYQSQLVPSGAAYFRTSGNNSNMNYLTVWR